jgi:subtilisin family serine protease
MPAHTVRAGVRAWALVLSIVALLVLISGPGGAARAGAAGLACPSTPAARPVVSELPWPQQRYDLTALSRITQGAGVTVAVLDSGVDTTNRHLAGAVRDGGSLLDGSGNGLEDCVGHGTAVASIIAARPVEGAGLVGVAPQATILSVRVSDRVQTEEGFAGTGDVAALVEGIEEAVAARPRPDVINLSISTTTDSPALREAIQAALEADIVVVAAVGNLAIQGNPTPYPAAYDGVVGVGAITSTGARYERSQVGPYVDIVAPGDAVTAAAPRGGHNAVSGTSFAVPFVAATAALIRARWPHAWRSSTGYWPPPTRHRVVNRHRSTATGY